MACEYQTERPKLFSEDGLDIYISLRDQVRNKSKIAGAVRFDKLSFSGDSWLALACMDLMIERKEIRRVTEGADRAGQHHVYEWIAE